MTESSDAEPLLVVTGMKRLVTLAVLSFSAGCASIAGSAADAKAWNSWNDCHARRTLERYVDEVTREESPHFIPEDDRIAVFDNDGTLWGEQPLYFQFVFAMDRIRAVAAEHPEWRTEEPFRSVLANDMEGVLAGGKPGLFKILLESHAGSTSEEFAREVAQWIDEARHPTTGRRYSEMVYQPMLELLDYLRSHGFKTYIVSGSGIDFMRVFTEEVYGIPPEQVIGTQLVTSYALVEGVPTITREPKIHHVDDEAGKPVSIHRFIGRKPVLAFGNSDGDYEMLEYTTVGNDHASLGFIVHHTDGVREVAYDRDSHIGRLNEGLDDADRLGWVLIDMANDWKSLYPAR